MGAADLLRGGDVDEALASLQDQIRSDPAEAKHRVFLFQLLCLKGQWDRALTQLNVVGELDSSALGMVAMYREALSVEALREEVFSGRKTPLVFGDPQEWVAFMLEAVRAEVDGDHAQAADLRDRALAMAPAVPGRRDDTEFEWLADADSRLGPLLEVVVNGKYFWVPFERIQSITFEPPADLRDLVWTPAEFVWANGGETVGIIPSRYPATHTAPDPDLLLARKTEWLEVNENAYHGLGQRMFATDTEDFSLLETREIHFNVDSQPTATDEA